MVDIDSEALAYWYLRLNGFLTTANFVVHPDSGSNQETDADVLGVRFPHRAENLVRPMKDDKFFTEDHGKILIVIAEVKTGRCNLNGPWTQPNRGNMVRVLRAIGPFKSKESELAAKGLYENGSYSNQRYKISLLCFGREKNEDVSQKYPSVRQILWPEVLAFIYNRFREYRREKSSHPQWDKAGHSLWSASDTSTDVQTFIDGIRVR